MTEELLVNFKNLMQRWFPLTTEVNSRFTDVMNKSGMDFNIREGGVIEFTQNALQYTDVPQYGWCYEGVESYLEENAPADYGVIIFEGKWFFRYDMVNESLDLLNKYDVSLQASNYNPPIDSNVTITATVTDEFGNTIHYFPITIKKNGSSLSSGITNTQGQFSLTYNCSEWGLTTFSANTANIQVNITGWKVLVNDSGYYIRRKNDTVQFALSLDSNISFPTTFTAFGGGARVPSGARPEASVVLVSKSNYNALVAVRTDGTVERRTLATSAQSITGYFFGEWTI